MQKLQILFPDPLMARMKQMASRMDLPVSEVVRRATERWLDRYPEQDPVSKAVPVINAGKCLMDAGEMRDAIYE